jgi:hypothetical protein
MSRRLIALCTVLSLTVATTSTNMAIAAASPSSAKPVDLPTAEFPLGIPGKPTYHTKHLVPGVDVITLTHGTSTDGYTLTIRVNGKTSTTSAKAERVAAELQEDGIPATVQRLTRPAVADFPRHTGYLVRAGQWPLDRRADAAKAVKTLAREGFDAVVDFLGDDGLQTTGPWQMQIIMIDPHRFQGTYRSTLGVATGRRETTSAMARRAGAIAAVNGGFFSIHAPRPFSGDPTGISVVAGRLLSEAVTGRTALILRGRTARITRLESAITARSYDGAHRTVDGVDRVAEDGELILYTDDLGTKTPADHGIEAVLDADGVVTGLRSAGARVKPGTRVLHGAGDAGEWLWRHAWQGQTLAITTKVTDMRTGKAVPLTPDTNIVGGGIGLVARGRRHITAAADGMANNNMILHRHPRTLAGVTRSGTLILATVDGRKPGVTVGASLPEAAELMRWLGARDAMNLDGGGSSTMVLKNKVLNDPSDGTERPVGDAVLIVPSS